MASKNGEFENPKMKGGSYFNRSMTIHHAAAVKPSVERLGSFKQLPGSSAFEAMVSVAGSSIKGKVKQLCSLFEKSPRAANSVSLPLPSPTKAAAAKLPNSDSSRARLPGTEDRVVIYFTSLRGIRRTFEDCYTVRMILKSFRVHVDERDISMDSAYKKELQSILGSKNVTLPQVFIKGNYIGGAEVIKQMNEVGELSRLLRGLPIRPPGFVCQGCGDARFIPCSNCNGSRKLFDEDEEQLRRCPDCNENGLVRWDSTDFTPMATVISALALSVVFFICNLTPTPAFADLVYEDGYSVTTVFDGNKLNIHPHSVLPQPGSSDLFLLDSTDSTVYALSIPESGEVSLRRLAGNGTAGYSDGDLSSAMFDKPKSFAVDARGNLYVADVKNYAVRKISKSGVTTIAGGFSNKAGKKDGSGKDATFSNDYELVFIPQRCALIVSDIGNTLVRQINLKPEDCSSDSQSALGSTTAWFLGVGISCLIGLIIGFVLRPYVIPHGGSRHRWYNRTWKRCQMNLGRPVLMLCFELRNAVVNSSSYSLLKQITYLTFSHLSLIFTSMFFPRIVEPQKPLEKPVSLLDLDNLDSSEPMKKYPRIEEVKGVPLLELDDTNTSKSAKPDAMANELKDLIHFDEGLLLSNKSESDFEDENETGSNGKIDGMIHANLCGFAELATATSSTEFPKSSLGLVAKRRVK